jgi:hypothetical protein
MKSIFVAILFLSQVSCLAQIAKTGRDSLRQVVDATVAGPAR